MTNRMIENRVRKIKALEQKKAELDKQIEQAKGELIAEMARKKTDILETENGTTVRYQDIISDRFNTTRFKTELPAVYQQYLVPQKTRRFTCKLAEG